MSQRDHGARIADKAKLPFGDIDVWLLPVTSFEFWYLVTAGAK